ncbi:hypothetical protein QTP88_003184 [Uroleucon formosanum]
MRSNLNVSFYLNGLIKNPIVSDTVQYLKSLNKSRSKSVTWVLHLSSGLNDSSAATTSYHVAAVQRNTITRHAHTVALSRSAQCASRRRLVLMFTWVTAFVRGVAYEDDKRGVGTAARVRPSRAGDRGTRQLGGNTEPAAGPEAALSARRTRHADDALPYRSRRRHRRRLTNDGR